MESLEGEPAFFPAGGISLQLPELDAFPEEPGPSEQAVGAEEVLHVRASGDEANGFFQALLELVGVTSVVCGSSFPEQVKPRAAQTLFERWALCL